MRNSASGSITRRRLKQLRADVHVLTLTATPIPRTLQMAMSGLRELSTIQTPPVDRLAVRTYVMEWDDMVMREALLREHHRGGQSFIVVPRIADMAEVEEWLAKHVPEVKFITAHGQMAAGEVEERMSAFYEGKYEVLLSTTIVESGLDIPRANTIIIHRADRFGLAQLYQLRGRVGRSKLRAYAYLTTPAARRLVRSCREAPESAQRSRQSGRWFPACQPRSRHSRRGQSAGRRAIRPYPRSRFRTLPVDAGRRDPGRQGGRSRAGEEHRRACRPQITVDAPIMIPEEYVPDLAVRMALYRRLNDADSQEEIESLSAEMIDRFGPLPDATANLVQLIEIKRQAIEAHIAKIDVGLRGTLVSFHNDSFPNPAGLIAYAERLQGTVKLAARQQAGAGPRLGRSQEPPERTVPVDQRPCSSRAQELIV